MRRWVLAALTSAACAQTSTPVVGASAAKTTSLPPLQEVDVGRGDEWEYLNQDTLTGQPLSTLDVVVVDSAAKKIDVRMRQTTSTTGLVQTGAATFDLFWRKLPDEVGGGEGSQDSWGARQRLQAGDEWSYSFDRPLLGGPTSMKWIGHGEALDAERVDLANGRTVDALKIEFFERPSVARFRYELHVIEWFSPEINRYVRREVETRLNGKITEATTEVLQDYVRRR